MGIHVVLSPITVKCKHLYTLIPKKEDNLSNTQITQMRPDTHPEPESCDRSSKLLAVFCSAHYKRRDCTQAVAALYVHSVLGSEDWSYRTSGTALYSCLALGLEGTRKER